MSVGAGREDSGGRGGVDACTHLQSVGLEVALEFEEVLLQPRHVEFEGLVCGRGRGGGRGGRGARVRARAGAREGVGGGADI